MKFLIGSCLLALSHSAYAHSLADATQSSGFLQGFLHPLLGVDHLLTMLAVGLWSAQLDKKIWHSPALFCIAMLFGAFLGIAQISLPGVEFAIALSLLLCGVLLLGRISPSNSLAFLLVPLAALFHGHAHGNEMPLEVSSLTYSLGFLSATLLLLSFGIVCGLGIKKSSRYARAFPLLGGFFALCATGLLLQQC